MTLAEYFRLFATEAKNGRSPLYERLSLAIAEDADMLALVETRRPGQPAPNLLFAAVHQELLAGANDPLKDYYPSCGGRRSPDDGDVYGAFQSFVRSRRERIAAAVASRVTNTNEVARSALLYPAYDWIARHARGALQILEIGPSAGLNLNWFRYGYRYVDEAGATVLERETGRDLVLTSTLKGAGRPPLAARLPEVAGVRGLELNPVSIADPAERLWQKALIWPERLDRLARLEPALAIAARHPPEIIHGDAARDLPKVLAAFDARLPVLVVHTAVTYQFRLTRERRSRRRLLRLRRPIGSSRSASSGRPKAFLSPSPSTPRRLPCTMCSAAPTPMAHGWNGCNCLVNWPFAACPLGATPLAFSDVESCRGPKEIYDLLRRPVA